MVYYLSMKERIYPREKYLKKIRPFYESDVVKVITGIRRCGKSCILKSIISELITNGVNEAQILYLPLDKRGFKDIKTPEQLENKIDSLLSVNYERYYLFIDEVQNVKGFESIVLAYQEEGFSVFLTGSNSYLLSDDITTKLTGRYVKFETFPLDFKEYLEAKQFLKIEIDDYDKEFMRYLLEGGFPKSLEFEDLSSRQLYTKSVVEEIFNKDIRKRKRIKNPMLFERIQSFIVNNYASPFSIQSMLKAFEKIGVRTKAVTVHSYISELIKAKIIYECNRFDLKSKRSLKRDQKYYLADLSIYFSANTDNSLNIGSSLENVIYLFLVSNGFEVSVGRIGNLECDFIVRTPEQSYCYIQVTYSLQAGDQKSTLQLKEREYRPFRSIKDGYPRYIISLDKYRDHQEGVNHINAVDLLLGKEVLSGTNK